MTPTQPFTAAALIAALEERLVDAFHDAIQAAQSPWATRHDAALFMGCSESEIDRGADAGIFKRYYRSGTPMFKKSEMSTALETARWTKRK